MMQAGRPTGPTPNSRRYAPCCAKRRIVKTAPSRRRPKRCAALSTNRSRIGERLSETEHGAGEKTNMAISRRQFVRNAAGGLAAVPLLADTQEAAAKGLPKRVLGRTKEKVSLLGFGTASLESCTPDEAARIVNLALDL